MPSPSINESFADELMFMTLFLAPHPPEGDAVTHMHTQTRARRSVAVGGRDAYLPHPPPPIGGGAGPPPPPKPRNRPPPGGLGGA